MGSLDILTQAAIGIAVAVSSGPTDSPGSAASAGRDDTVARAASRRVFFGHQSVGTNVLDGVSRLARDASVAVVIADPGQSLPPGRGGFEQVLVADNGDPLRKLASFEEALASASLGLDVALVKFCYVDFTAGTNVQAIFEAYRKTLDRLARRHPGVTFVHVTVPLTTIQTGPKAWVKRLLGRAPGGVTENARRTEFNELLRRTYLDREPVFDLARVESTLPDGTAANEMLDGKPVPYLVPAYSDDGGHLNAEGKARAARALLSVLASLPPRTGDRAPVLSP